MEFLPEGAGRGSRAHALAIGTVERGLASRAKEEGTESILQKTEL